MARYKSSRAETGCLPAGAGLGHGQRADLPAGRHVGDEALDLLRGAEVGDVRHHDVRVHGVAGAGAVAVASVERHKRTGQWE